MEKKTLFVLQCEPNWEDQRRENNDCNSRCIIIYDYKTNIHTFMIIKQTFTQTNIQSNKTKTKQTFTQTNKQTSKQWLKQQMHHLKTNFTSQHLFCLTALSRRGRLLGNPFLTPKSFPETRGKSWGSRKISYSRESGS